MNKQGPTAREVSDEFFDGLAAIWRWLVLVAAIAVGTCLGITLFVVVVMGLVANQMGDVHLGPFAKTTATSTPTR